jgi:hypothetical protein
MNKLVYILAGAGLMALVVLGLFAWKATVRLPVQKPAEQLQGKADKPVEIPVFENKVKNLKPEDKLILNGKEITKAEYDVKKADKIKFVQEALQGVAQDPNTLPADMLEWQAMVNLEGCGKGLENVVIGSQAEQAALIQLLNIKLSNGC